MIEHLFREMRRVVTEQHQRPGQGLRHVFLRSQLEACAVVAERTCSPAFADENPRPVDGQRFADDGQFGSRELLQIMLQLEGRELRRAGRLFREHDRGLGPAIRSQRQHFICCRRVRSRW